MLPLIKSSKGIVIGILVFCFYSETVTAGELTSNILRNKENSLGNDGISEVFHNDMIFLNNRVEVDLLSCLHCNGADCNDPQSKKCATDSKDDLCYIFLDVQSQAITRMGCKSDLLAEDIEKNIKQYFLCDGDDCNNSKNLPEKITCMECDSTKDINCAIDPTKINTQKECQTQPFTDCYARINKDGHTQRGCFIDMPTEDFIKCKNGDPTEICKVCTENNCNGALYPSKRQKCHRCNSADDSSCESNPNNEQVCPTYNSSDVCVTKLINGITHRDCLSELTCADSNYQHCKFCEENNCNTMDLKSKLIGDPGLFQDLPLNCYHCNSCTSSFGVLKECTGNKLQTCTTAFDKRGAILGRGCSDSFNSICEYSENSCYDCKSNSCNEAAKESDFIDCIFCDSAENDQCIFGVDNVKNRRKCNKACMTKLYPRTNDKDAAYELIRTCLDDLDANDRKTCENGQDKEHCIACTGADCNKNDLGVRKSCYHCKGNDCQMPESKTCRATMANDQCFIEYDESNSVVEMGCKSKYDAQDLSILLNAKRIWLCDNDNCNKVENVIESQSCVICNSRTDPNCAIAPTELKDTTTCNRKPYTNCYMRVLEDGHTERGCLSSLEDIAFVECLDGSNSQLCMACSGDNCNNKLYPEGRLSCHTCNSSIEAACEKSPAFSKVCSKYTLNEQCVTQLDKNLNTVRGCNSDLSCNSNDDDAKCETCSGDNCNTSYLKRKLDGKPGKWQELPIKCYTCNDATECAGDKKELECQNNEYCMTVFNKDGAVQARGCSSGIESTYSKYCDGNSENCFNCNSNNCNAAEKLTDYVECVYCDSERYPDCVYNPKLIDARRMCNGGCMTAIYSKNNTDDFGLIRSCLDDKEKTDQNACGAGDASCFACKDAACNTNDFPADRWSCHVCIDSDCEDSKPQQCKNYKENDQCYMQFEKTNSILRMGCASDLEATFIADNIDSLLFCDGEPNCNTFENIPQPIRCFECDSADNPDCASSPESIPTIVSCTTLPNTQCFTQISDGFTKRGCISSLPQLEKRTCLSGESNECISCNDDNCNNKVYPQNRRRCHRCNSLEDATCENSPSSASICPFYTKDEFCSTKLVNGVTYRGCSSDFQCDSTDYGNCRMCNGTDSCNVINLKKSNVGYPGTWQGLPLNCYTCQGEECRTGSGVVRKCEGDIMQNCGTIFANNGSVLQRGCSNDIYDNMALLSYCDANPDYCKFCKSNGCNTAESINDFVDCIFCDGTENVDCVLNVRNVKETRSCFKKCLTALYPRKAEVNPAYVMTRSCYDDLDMDDIEACENGNKEFCEICEGALCNSVSLPNTSRLNCYVCNGDDCEEPKSQMCSTYRENDQCFALFDNSTNKLLRLGCGSEYDNFDLVANRRKLFLCNGDNCNEKSNLPNARSCSLCTSTILPSCATSPQNPLFTTSCNDLPFTQCYTRVDEGGVTRRGCVSELTDEVFDDCMKNNSGKCKMCDEEDCNTDVFPENRRSCYRCDSRENESCEESPQQYASICPVYSDDENCVTEVFGPHLMRGCATDFTCDESNPQKCRTCNSDNCNSIDLLQAYIGEPGRWQDLPLTCYTCEGASCTNALGETKKCEGNNLQTCVTVFGSDGVVQNRGCSDAVAQTHGNYCDENTDKCLACKSNNCNEAKSLADYSDCYFCDSADGSDCVSNVSSKTRKRKCFGSCMVALYPRSNAVNPVYELTRSCLDDMEQDDRAKCQAGEKQYCTACEGALCNTMPIEVERHECFKCMSSDCEDIGTQECRAYQPNDQCYILYNNQSSIVDMGCRSELEMEVVTDLVKQKHLILCNGKNCNTPTIVKPTICLMCDSSEDPRCATNPNLMDNSVKCAALPYTDCFTRIDKDKHTIRGCVSSLDSEEFYGCLMKSDGLCQTCSSDNCNAIDIFPADRLTCHQCDSSSDKECESSPNANQVCPIYDAEESCVTSLRNGITYRGCSSNIKCYDEKDHRNCRRCNTPGCNTVDLVKVPPDGEPGKWQDVPLNCLHCADEEDCARNQVFRPCQNNLYQNCMTVFNLAGRVQERGCSDSIESNNKEFCAEHPNMCFRCNSNGCNEATSLNEYVECLSCDSSRSNECVNDVTNVLTTRKCYKQCLTVLYPREEEDNPAFHLTRSCLDDMDLDDQEACANGKKQYCKACNTTKCNTDEIPEKRLSCNICQGENCQLPVEKSCPTYRDNDMCYVLYDETHSITAMGCRSEFSNSEADYLLMQKRLYLCTDDNCNNIEKLPKPQYCAVCSSRTDIGCAVHPENQTAYAYCSVSPFTDCYSRVLFDGTTERGCLSNLFDDEFLSCQSGNSSTCSTCVGEICNKNIFPENRARCHICDSRSDPKCEGRPNSVEICPIYSEEESCVTVYNDGITQRDCSSNLTCNGVGAKGCSTCIGPGCNTVNLAKRQDDNYGKWQDLPLSCYACDGSECLNQSKSKLVNCENNNEQDCMVVFNESGEVIKRGCQDEVEKTHEYYCDEFKDLCMNCKSNKCNVATSLTEYKDCIYCESNKDQNCLWEPQSELHSTRKCRGKCMTALYPSDLSSNPTYDIIRTCLDDKEVADQTTCSNGKDEKCSACTGNNCNVINLPENRLSCFYCTNGNCENPEPKKCPLYKENDQCYIWFDTTNSVQEMGCISSFRNQELENIIKTKRVYVCNEDSNCNSLDKLSYSQKCATCSSKDDSSCAVNPKAIGTFNECNMMPYTSCYSKLISDGSTSRGCLTELSTDDFASCLLGEDPNCEICNGDACNREVYPADRQQCYTCTSLDDDSCESFPSVMQPCPIVNDKESCRTALSGNETVRGCSSEIYCDANDSKTCRSCFGTSCNSIDLRNKIDEGYHGVWQELPLQCHQCTGEDCAASLGAIVTCTGNIEQDCMVVFAMNGTVRRRGCSDAVEDYEDLFCRLYPHLCFKCKSNECNIAWSPTEYVECEFCNSMDNTACIINPNSNEIGVKKCYKECMVTMKNNDDIIRSCLDDKDLFDRSECRSQGMTGKNCASCSGERCNNFIYPIDRLKCHECLGSDCSRSVGQYCLKYDENDFCFAKYEGTKVQLMGCASTQDVKDLEEWRQQNLLFSCNTTDCNEITQLPSSGGICLSCDSSKSPECAQSPKDLNNFESCEGPNSDCITHISNGKTIRSCANKLSATELESCKSNGSCDICKGEKCNTEIFPAGRRQCHICNSLQDDKCAKSPNTVQICPNYDANNRCVAKFDGSVVERGCSSDITCDINNQQGCQICDSDGCNIADLTAGAAALAASLLLTTILAFITIRSRYLF